MTAEEKYVAAAYLAVFLVVLVYVLIMSAKVQRLQRELGDVAARLRERRTGPPEQTSTEELELAKREKVARG